MRVITKYEKPVNFEITKEYFEIVRNKCENGYYGDGHNLPVFYTHYIVNRREIVFKMVNGLYVECVKRTLHEETEGADIKDAERFMIHVAHISEIDFQQEVSSAKDNQCFTVRCELSGLYHKNWDTHVYELKYNGDKKDEIKRFVSLEYNKYAPYPYESFPAKVEPFTLPKEFGDELTDVLPFFDKQGKAVYPNPRRKG